MDDSDEELKMVKRPHNRVRFHLTDEDGDDDEVGDLQPPAENVPARSPTDRGY